ncbi:consortin [Cheilinus undulatus]|uniref:consortin n=1 Tax=Cheilinus undulatus TaxID=241271 RepID=UPI001BD249C2|nr:consortin [Cheilinus undulatus]
MDHGGQFEREGRVMSHIQVGEVDLCDNLPNPQALTAQTRNLNETNTLTNTQSLSPSQHEDGGEHTLIHDAVLCESGKEGYTGRGGEEDEEEDMDEMMKEDEEEEESEGSSCLIRCQSPGTPMTDSSYSETGSLLETPYPFSPGTSPEPTSPVVPVVSPETTYPTSQVEVSQNVVKVDSDNSNTESFAESGTETVAPALVSTGPVDCTTLTQTSDIKPDSPPGSILTTAKNTSTTAECLTSSTETFFNHGPSVSVTSTPVGSTTGSLTYATGHTTTGTESTSTTGPQTLSWEHIIASTPVPTSFLVPTCATGPIPSPALLETLEELAKRGDEPYLPQYLHQIAEAFVLQEDYQQALWCIQLERLYHQRILENLNALQEQWESQCRGTSSSLETQHLDTLKHICQTHSRPRAKDASCASQNLLSSTIKERGALTTCTSAHQSDRGMEQRAADSSHSLSSCPVKPSINLSDGHNSPEMSEKDRRDPDRESPGRDFSDSEGRKPEEGVGRTISVIGNELHPSLTGEMDQPKPAEQQGGDLGLAEEKEAKREEETEVEEAAEALEMEEEGEEEEEEKQRERESPFCQKALPVETLISGAEVEAQHLHQEARTEEKQHDETQESDKTYLEQEAHLPTGAHVKQQKQTEERMEEEEEEEYEVEQADLIREAAVLDNMAKLITIEEMSPASGLVSILKKRKVCVDDMSVPATVEPQPDKTPAKRRVRFKVPDDSYEHDVGGGDSCLLLFLLCMVTVVISVGGTALYCALGDAHSSVCQDFSRNADFYMGQLQRGIAHIQHLFTSGS